MGKHERVRERVVSGQADANIGFDDLCRLLEHLGFSVRQKGSHRIFSHETIRDIVNLQPRPDGKAKNYQVKQVRELLSNHSLNEK